MDELETKLFWHFLPQCPNKILLRIQDEFGRLPNPEELLSESADWVPELLRDKVRSQLRKPSAELSARLAKAKEFISQQNIDCIERLSIQYPSLLAQIPDPPALLYCRGTIASLHNPQIAIVGSRASSRAGQRDAEAFAASLSGSGFTITSGLALGIDTFAHSGALKRNSLTIAVIGSGLDKIYPSRNWDLANQIVDGGGLLLTEFPPGTPPRRENFPQRNRIISGLSLATLVIEASERSGSLITARLALEQGREVMVLPGNIHDPLKRGCHRLIRDGATLVNSADQIVEQLGSLLGFQMECLGSLSEKKPLEQFSSTDPRLKKLLDHIEFEPTGIDDLLELTSFTTLELAELLTDLELEGLIARSAEGISRIR